MTSNAGAEMIANGIAPLGFTSESESINQIESEKILAIAQKHLKPEFLNRLDDLVIFRRSGNRVEFDQQKLLFFPA